MLRNREVGLAIRMQIHESINNSRDSNSESRLEAPKRIKTSRAIALIAPRPCLMVGEMPYANNDASCLRFGSGAWYRHTAFLSLDNVIGFGSSHAVHEAIISFSLPASIA